VISDRLRCIFIHIPKCAGTSIEDVLWPHPRGEDELWGGFVDRYNNRYQTGGLQHLTAALVRDAVGSERFERYFKFTVIRNPWDRAVSQYVFMQRRPDLRELAGIAEDASFTAYLRAIAAAPAHVQWTAQERFLYDADGRLLVDRIVRFETLDQQIAGVFARLGIEAELPHRNAGERGEARHYYDDESRALVAQLYAGDIERFGYAFPG
jgi:hypothetical protein